MIVSGGATVEETAAIAAVVAHLLAEEAAAAAIPRRRPRQSDWIRAWRPRNVTAIERSAMGGGFPGRRIDPKS